VFVNFPLDQLKVTIFFLFLLRLIDFFKVSLVYSVCTRYTRPIRGCVGETDRWGHPAFGRAIFLGLIRKKTGAYYAGDRLPSWSRRRD
jgi:hypothetical protein